MSTICIIPARGGSKRLPRKNILPLGGITLLERVISSAMESQLFDKIVVSSDDDEILEIANNAHAIAHRRPAHLGEDRATVVQTCIETLEHYSSDIFCCLYATAALISANTLIESYDKFRTHPEANVEIGVSRFNYPPVQALKLDNEGFASMLMPEYKAIQSQFHPEMRVSNGTLCWVRTRNFLQEKTFYSSRLLTFEVNEQEVVDIDTPEDFQRLVELFNSSR